MKENPGSGLHITSRAVISVLMFVPKEPSPIHLNFVPGSCGPYFSSVLNYYQSPATNWQKQFASISRASATEVAPQCIQLILVQCWQE